MLDPLSRRTISGFSQETGSKRALGRDFSRLSHDFDRVFSPKDQADVMLYAWCLTVA
ncbi:hypothetical protein [Microbacterium bovistercoris]|uniref:hypothetical protein n=1 Tax=Microbacterium bovistercoris TaxID=2293570 RepID=UPI0015F28EE6|nr:hypothetical protein [Microbacterium bovistercoris]